MNYNSKWHIGIICALIIVSFLFLNTCGGDEDITGDDNTSSTSSSSSSGGQSLPTNVTPEADITSSNFTSYPVTLAPQSARLIIISNHTESRANTESGWWHEAVIYQVFTYAFDSGSLPDSQMSYLQDLGIDAVWTTPIFESPSLLGANKHGYDTKNYSNVASLFGGNSALTSYISSANTAGIKVILDMVINHSADNHPWFQNSAGQTGGFDDWYVWSNTQPSDTDWGYPWSGGNPSDVWHENTTRGDYYYGAFWDGMPDLNLENNSVQQAIKSIASHWINQGVAGFRLDAARYAIEEGPYPDQADTQSTKNWWTNYQAHLESEDNDFYTIGEFWTDNLVQLDGYYSGGKGLSQGFSFQFYYAILASLGSANSPAGVRTYINDLKAQSAPLHFFAPFLDNHDEPDGNWRLMDRLAGTAGDKNWPRARQAAAITLTFPGTPYIYYGTEIGMNKTEDSGDLAKRGAMDWAEASSQQSDPDSLFKTYKDLIYLRHQHTSLSRGDIRLITHDKSSTVLAYLRPGDQESILVLVNFSGNTNTVNLDFSGSGLLSDSTYNVATLYDTSGATNTSSDGQIYDSMYVRGDFNSWTNSNPMTYSSNHIWTATISSVSSGDEFKFEVTGSGTWGDNWGDTNDDGIAEANTGTGENIVVTHTGTVTFTFNEETLEYTMSN